MNYPNLEALIETIRILRSENGCAWDRVQTHETLKRNILEEAYETVDAINSKDTENLKEELGDVLLQVLLHSQIADDNNCFNIEDVAEKLNKKLIHRHPHVFGNVKTQDTNEILANWDKLKAEEKTERKSLMDGISKAQSALMSAQKISSKAVKAGFEWENNEQLMDCIKSEFREFEEAKTFEDKEEEFGDILFALVNLARRNNIDAEQALIRSNNKFKARFREMEKSAVKPLCELTFEEWDNLWKKAKKEVIKKQNKEVLK